MVIRVWCLSWKWCEPKCFFIKTIATFYKLNITDLYSIPVGTILLIPRKSTASPSTPSYGAPKHLASVVATGESVRARQAGTVSFTAKSFSTFGPSVMVEYASDKRDFYGNVGDIQVQVGAQIKKGAVIGIRREGDPKFEFLMLRGDAVIDSGKP